MVLVENCIDVVVVVVIEVIEGDFVVCCVDEGFGCLWVVVVGVGWNYCDGYCLVVCGVVGC